MKLSDELSWRGFINQTTFAEIADIDQPRTFYFGVDPSADSMTIGNLASAMLVRHFMDHGHKAILLVGGATGMIGDPDGKKQERDLRNEAAVEQNTKALAKELRLIFGGKSFDIVNNYDWFKDINYIEFLHKIGKHVSMTQLLDRDFVQARIGEGGSGISYGEFSYSLIQGYDFLHLFREKNVTLQLAGADQWGNSITGVSLIRKLEGGESHVVTAPLVVNKQTGVKFGKTEGGAVWLNPAKTSPYKFYQFWLNVDDATAEDMIKIYTLLPREEVERVIAAHSENPASRILQRTIAREVTSLVHGSDRMIAVERATETLFGSGNMAELDSKEVLELASELPTVSVGCTVIDALIESNTCAGKGEARRLLSSSAISVNGKKVQEDIYINDVTLIKKGKNTFILVK